MSLAIKRQCLINKKQCVINKIQLPDDALEIIKSNLFFDKVQTEARKHRKQLTEILNARKHHIQMIEIIKKSWVSSYYNVDTDGWIHEFNYKNITLTAEYCEVCGNCMSDSQVFNRCHCTIIFDDAWREAHKEILQDYGYY